MKSTAIPTKFPIPFADTGTKNTIPEASQIGITFGAASLTDGFPPATFTPTASGGVGPDGADFNGILYEITAGLQWANAGALYGYDSTFSTAISGYPKGAVLVMSSGNGLWYSNVDDNTVDPDAEVSANWSPILLDRVTTLNATATLTADDAGLVLINAAGGSVTLTLPAAASLVGMPFYFVRTDTSANTVTIQRAGSDSINGSVSETLVNGYPLALKGDGVSTFYRLTPSKAELDARYAALAGSSTQTFDVADAAAGTQQAIPISQADARYPSNVLVTAGTAYSFGSMGSGSTTNSSMTQVASVEFWFPGGYRITSACTISGSGNTMNYQIYKNGTPYGTLHGSPGGATTATFTDDIAVVPGDKIEIYISTHYGGDTVAVTSADVSSAEAPWAFPFK